MKKHSDPIEYILNFVEGDEYFVQHDSFVLQNAWDELRSLKEKVEQLKNKLSQYTSIGTVCINDRGDYYNLGLQINPFETNTIPVYSNKEEFKSALDKIRYKE